MTALRQNLIQRLVDQELIRQYAKELKLGVSDDDDQTCDCKRS